MKRAVADAEAQADRLQLLVDDTATRGRGSRPPAAARRAHRSSSRRSGARSAGWCCARQCPGDAAGPDVAAPSAASPCRAHPDRRTAAVSPPPWPPPRAARRASARMNARAPPASSFASRSSIALRRALPASCWVESAAAAAASPPPAGRPPPAVAAAGRRRCRAWPAGRRRRSPAAARRRACGRLAGSAAGAAGGELPPAAPADAGAGACRPARPALPWRLPLPAASAADHRRRRPPPFTAAPRPRASRAALPDSAPGTSRRSAGIAAPRRARAARCLARDLDVDVRRHARLQLQLGVRHGDDRRVGDDVLDRRRLQAHLLHGR